MTTSASARTGEAPFIEGEYPFSRDDFQKIATLLREHSGIALAEAKATLVYSRLAKRLRSLGLDSFKEYVRLVSAPGGEKERSLMLAALTTNVTRFFREPHHFEHFAESVLKPMLSSVRAGARLRVWSSACSTGQEPYSLALTILSHLPEAPKLDVRILATDIDPFVVETARKGVYSDEAVQSIAPGMRERWLEKERAGAERAWRMGAEARALITFKELNLIGPWPMRGRFDAIFCRNVVIYFEEDTQNKVWKRFQEYLNPEGRLYIGHSERIDRPDFVSDGLTVYKLKARGVS